MAGMTRTSKVRGRLHLEKDGAPFLSGGRLDLLEAIAAHGSITQAAAVVGISYKSAWEAVDTMNNQADQPLVVRSPGGRQGGGTRLTDYGRHVIKLVRTIESEYQEALATLLAERSGDFGEYQRLRRRFSLQTSARNQWAGVVSAIHADRVHAEVHVAVDPTTTIVSVISTQSVRRLGLHPGMEVYALMKAAGIVVERAAAKAVSGPNRFVGTLAKVFRDNDEVELSIDLAGGRSVAAFCSNDGKVAALDPGGKVLVSFDPRSVLLVVV